MRIPSAPLPQVRDLLKGLTAPAFEGEAWYGKGEGKYAVRFYRRGSFALAAGVNAWRRAQGAAAVTLWVPDYFCNEALEPLRTATVSLRFYPIREDLTPDYGFLEDALPLAAHPQVFLLVHYFGFANSLDEASKFCQRHRVALLEDSAHVDRKSVV